MHKFRTMVPNAEAMKEQLRHLNELEWPDFKITNDPWIDAVRSHPAQDEPRRTPPAVGRGPARPPQPGRPRPTDFMADTYRLWQTERLDVKPGVTGLWQIYGRGLAEFDDRTRLDIAYIQRRSVWLDIQILVRTIPVVLANAGEVRSPWI